MNKLLDLLIFALKEILPANMMVVLDDCLPDWQTYHLPK